MLGASTNAEQTLQERPEVRLLAKNRSAMSTLMSINHLIDPGTRERREDHTVFRLSGPLIVPEMAALQGLILPWNEPTVEAEAAQRREFCLSGFGERLFEGVRTLSETDPKIDA